MRRLIDEPRIRQCAVLLVALVLVSAVIFQRQTIAQALNEIGELSAATVVVLLLLGVLDRASRAEVIRSLLPELTLTRSEMISDVGAAASKGIPAGGPLATVLRWQLARERCVPGTRFIVMLVASGVATAFVSWGYPLVATVVDMAGRDSDLADLAIVSVCAVVLGGAALFWLLMLRSERAHLFVIARSEWVVARWPAVLGDVDPVASDRDLAARVVDEIRDGLRTIAGRPVGLLLRTLVVQGTGAVILWVALRGLGVGDELEVAEFARVYFVAHILGSLAPTPGGLGVIEAGVTGALVAAGVDTELALAGVLIYRFLTYVMPIILGTAWYVWWRCQRSAGRPQEVGVSSVPSDRWATPLTRRTGTSNSSTPAFQTFHALRIKSFATVDTLIAMTALPPGGVKANLMNMFEADQVQFCEASDSWQLTPDGRLAYPDLLAADLASVETADLAPSYEKFLAINSSFQDLRGEWRLREGDFNDHSDATYDENVIDRLAALDAAAQPVVVVLSGELERKRPYAGRLTRSLTCLQQGETNKFTGVMCGSYHDVWAELHEDLILTQSINRSAEGSF